MSRSQNINIPFTDLYSQYKELKKDMDNSITEIITNSDFLTGKTVEKFEQSICNYTKSESCASVSSGTMALICALRALNIGKNDKVITVGHTFISTTESILSVGAKPIFVDIDKYFHLDIKKLKYYKNTKAILFVDLYGQTPDIDKLKRFAKKHNLYLIEDAAQSFGSSYKGKKVGNLVDLTCFSFNPIKNLGAMGDAGAVTGKKYLIDKVKMYRDHGRYNSMYKEVGYQGRIDNIQAVIIQNKLKKLDQWIEKKIKICRRYTEHLKHIVKTPEETSWSKHTYYVYVIETPNNSRGKLKKYLLDNNIVTNINYREPTHLYCSNAKLPKTEYMCNSILSLPCYHTLTIKQQDYIINKIKEFYKNEKNIIS